LRLETRRLRSSISLAATVDVGAQRAVRGDAQERVLDSLPPAPARGARVSDATSLGRQVDRAVLLLGDVASNGSPAGAGGFCVTSIGTAVSCPLYDARYA
jgi:hypothetical protein